MSYSEVRSLLKLGSTWNSHRFSAENCDAETVYQSETQKITTVDFYGGCSMIFCADEITGQCRVFVDSELNVENGRVILRNGGEVGCAEWN